ncbi:hypothetical protein [Rhodococcus sp. JS3073]|uniref:hypothetical protein n=1 Tax=Rhodococcus sp. JS3073 TaxID=3002901 RepID=UPI003FA6FCDA
MYEELVRSNYTSLRVIGVEVPRQTAHEQALYRWWDGRLAWRADPASLGGRFTPPAAIDDCYDDPMSKCTQNVRALAAAARNREGDGSGTRAVPPRLCRRLGNRRLNRHYGRCRGPSTPSPLAGWRAHTTSAFINRPQDRVNALKFGWVLFDSEHHVIRQRRSIFGAEAQH